MPRRDELSDLEAGDIAEALRYPADAVRERELQLRPIACGDAEREA